MQETSHGPEQSILVVDDNAANVQLLAGMLKDRGYKVRAALSGKLAIQAARNNPPDLILLDVNMPEMNGYEVCERLKSDERLRDIPVIFVSALHETLDKVRAFGTGGVDYITKPFQFQEVEARVRTHLELCRQRRELRESFVDLQRLEKLRDELVHMVVHDLRNPLGAIIGYLDLVILTEERVLSAKGLRHLRSASGAVSTLLGMVNEMLDVSKMEAGAMKLNLVRCDPAAIAKGIIQSMEGIRGQRALHVDTPAGPLEVVADLDLVQRVIQNLVGNAIKATPSDGWIRIGVEAAGGGVRVTVRDNGHGIPKAYQPRIFEKFDQAGNGSTDRRYSTGLGLTFCKLAIEAHGGRIGVDSEEGRGSAFWFELDANGPRGDQRS